MNFKFSLLVFFLILCGCISPIISQDLDNLIVEHLINFKSLKIQDYDDGVRLTITLKKIENFTDDVDPDVRYRCYKLVHKIGVSTSIDSIKSQALEILIKSTVDKEHYVRQRHKKSFSYYNKKLFTRKIIEKLKTYMQDEKQANEIHFLLAGYLDMYDEKPLLKKIISNSLVNSEKHLDEKILESKAFAAHLALARMGDAEHINYCIERIKREEEENLVLFYLGMISYLKQPEAVDFLVTYLNSDKTMSDGEYWIESYANRVMHFLIPMVKNFPIKLKKTRMYSDKEIKQARDWIARNKSKVIIDRGVW